MATVGYCYDPIFLEHDSPGHPENAERLKAIMALLRRRNALADTPAIPFAPATFEALAHIHTPAYLSRLYAVCERGGGALNPDTYATPRTFDAASMAVGVITVLFSHEPAPRALTPARGVAAWLQSALVEPFADFFRRYGWNALLVLALIATYRVSDIVMGIMANPFYVDMGYSKDEVAAVTKVYGVIMTLVGAGLGGVLSMKFGVMRTLMLGAVLSAASNLLFSWLATLGHDVTWLTVVISIDNLSAGIASSAFIAYMSSLTNISYSATQYALLSSMMLLLPKWLAGFSGVAVDALGYRSFFTGTALLGVPVLGLIWLASRRLQHHQLSGKTNV